MNKRKAILVSTLALLPALTGLTGCGQQAAQVSFDFSFWYTFNKDAEPKLFELTAKFQQIMLEKTGRLINIDLQKYGGYPNIKEKIETGIRTGNVPTMAIAYPDHVAAYMKQGRDLGDATKYVWNVETFMNDPEIGLGKQTYLGDDPENPNDFFPAFLDEGTHFIVEGTYSMPLMKSTEVLFYNKAVASAYLNQYEPFTSLNPRKSVHNYLSSITWDEFMDLCDFISQDIRGSKSIGPSSLKYALGYDSDANLLITRMAQTGITYSSIDKTNQKGIIGFKEDVSATDFIATRDELKLLKTSYDNKALITKLANGNNYTNDLFTAQETVFSVGSSGGSDYQEPKGSLFTTEVTKVPAVSGQEQWISQGASVAFLKNPSLSDEQNRDAGRLAWQYYKFLTNPEYNVDMCFNSKGYYPVRESALETDDWAEMEEDKESLRYKTMYAITNNVKNRYFNSAVFAGSSDLRTEVGKLVGQVLLSNDSSDEAIEALIRVRVNEAQNFIK